MASHSTLTDPTRQVTLISLVRRTAQLMVAELVERLTAAGYPDLPAATHPVFENLDRDGTRLTELAARADMTHQSMGELIDTLERRGYLERRPDPADGRARLVCLTNKGRQMARIALREITSIEADWTHAWQAAGPRTDLRTSLENALAQPTTPPAPPVAWGLSAGGGERGGAHDTTVAGPRRLPT
jgi:DNA-binding MarR family transcriptional regulator